MTPARLALLSMGLVATFLLVVPETVLHVIRAGLPWVDTSLVWLDTRWPGWDLDHLVVFSILGATTAFAIRHARPSMLLALLAFATAAELVQLWVPTRTASLRDLTLNLAGSLVGYSLALLVTRRAPVLARAAPRRPLQDTRD